MQEALEQGFVRFVGAGVLIRALLMDIFAQAGIAHRAVLVQRERDRRLEAIQKHGGFWVWHRHCKPDGCVENVVSFVPVEHITDYVSRPMEHLENWASPWFTDLITNGPIWDVNESRGVDGESVTPLHPVPFGQPAHPFTVSRVAAGLAMRVKARLDGVEVGPVNLYTVENVPNNHEDAAKALQKVIEKAAISDKDGYGVFAEEMLASIDYNQKELPTNPLLIIRPTVVDRLVPRGGVFVDDPSSGYPRPNPCLTDEDIEWVNRKYPEACKNPEFLLAEGYGLWSVGYRDGDRRLVEHPLVQYRSYADVELDSIDKRLTVNGLRQWVAGLAHCACPHPNRHPLTSLFSNIWECDWCLPRVEELMVEHDSVIKYSLRGRDSIFFRDFVPRNSCRAYSGTLGGTFGTSFGGLKTFVDRTSLSYQNYFEVHGVLAQEMTKILEAMGLQPSDLLRKADVSD